MSIDPISSLVNALSKGPPLPGAHNRSWVSNHGQAHDGGRGGFPLGLGAGPADIGRQLPGFGGERPNLPHGIDRPNHPHGGPPGLERPNHPHGGPPGLDRPNQPQAAPPGVDRAQPGLVSQVQGGVRDVIGLPPQRPGAAPAGPQGTGHSQPVQLPAPALANAPAHSTPVPMHAAHAQAALFGGPGATNLHHALGPQQAQTALPVRADAATQVAHAAQAARADPMQAPPARAELAQAPRADATAAERMAMLNRAAAAPMPLASMTTAATAAHTAATHAATLATAAAGTPMASATAATMATQATEARSVNPLIAADRGGQVVARTDAAGTYTGEGPYRRGLRSAARALPGGLSTLLMAFGAQGNTGASGRDPAAIERELRAAMMQWLFWLLAIIAYGCVAFAVIGLLPPGSLGGGASTTVDNRAWTGGFALAGLVAGLGAWWFARGMARGNDNGSRDGDGGD